MLTHTHTHTASLSLRSARDYAYLMKGGTPEINGVDDARDFAAVVVCEFCPVVRSNESFYLARS